MRITLPSGTVAEEARPDGDPHLGVVVAADIWGLRPLYDEMAARLARDWQAVVVVPEPFPGQDIPQEIEPRQAAVRAKDDDATLRDLVEAADATGQDRVVLVGFCMGGMYAFKAAALGRFDRVVAFYGMIRVPPTFAGPGHAQPLDRLAVPGAAPVLAIIGSVDPYTPPADVADLQARPNVEVVVYEGADHGFVHDPSRPTHRPDDAADAWARAAAFAGV
jgi:carboxymethylenebutenolidase